MKLYAGSNCLYGHACRIVLKEKDVDCDVLDPAADPEFDLTELNPYGAVSYTHLTLPTILLV